MLSFIKYELTVLLEWAGNDIWQMSEWLLSLDLIFVVDGGGGGSPAQKSNKHCPPTTTRTCTHARPHIMKDLTWFCKQAAPIKFKICVCVCVCGGLRSMPRLFLGPWFYRTCDWIRRSHGRRGCMIRFTFLKVRCSVAPLASDHTEQRTAAEHSALRGQHHGEQRAESCADHRLLLRHRVTNRRHAGQRWEEAVPW